MQRPQPRRRGGHPLVGGGERHPDVPFPGRAVQFAGGDQDAGLGGEQFGRRPAVVRLPVLDPFFTVMALPAAHK